MLPDMNEKKGKLSLQISSKGTSYAGSQVLPFWQGVSVGKEFKKKLGTAFLFEFCVPSCLGKSRWIVKSPFPASPICATLTCSGSERFKPSEFIRHKFLCQFFAKRGTTCEVERKGFWNLNSGACSWRCNNVNQASIWFSVLLKRPCIFFKASK